MGMNPRIVRALHNAAVMCVVIAVMVAMAALGACGSPAGSGPAGSSGSSSSASASASAGSSAGEPGGSSPGDSAESSSGASGGSSSAKRDWGDSGCSKQGVRVIMARGTNESADNGLLNPVAKQISAAFGGDVQITSLDYPATFDVDSVDTGVGRLVAMLNGQAQQCPAQKTVLMGFSQGAIVVGDALVAPRNRFDPSGNKDELTAAAGKSIAAVVMYGDPRFNGRAAYNRGTFDAAVNGSFSPRGTGELDAYKDRIADFCAAKDIVCQQGGEQQEHARYFSDGSQTQGAQFAIAKVRAAK
ncbi:cutinase family protein [Bifidobacterium primatium]|nr:cutinase family protein [Bifidobacterium primatium]